LTAINPGERGACHASGQGGGARMSEGPDTADLSAVLEGLPADQPLTFAELARRMGSRAHGLALVLLALPEAMPLPVPSLSAVLGVPMMAVSAHLALHGEGGDLPGWLGRRRVPGALLGLLRGRLMSRAERMTRNRLQGLARRERLIGAVCVVLSLLLLLPLPLVNTPPAVCLLLLAWGLMRRDGVFVLAGLVGTVALLAVVGWAAVASRDLLARWFG
jgi:hypothetical protein